MKKITTININGGLGNQMFQYAFGYAVSQKNNTDLNLDISGFNAYDLRDYGLELYDIKEGPKSKFETRYKFFLDRINNGDTTFLGKIARRLSRLLLGLTKSYHQEKIEFVFDKDVFNAKTDTYFSGYWQSENYFKDYRDDLLEIFKLKMLHSKTKIYQKKIIENKSVSLHVRRGDYLALNQVQDMEYYYKAVSLFESKTTHFFIFSDDLEWVKNNFDFISQKTFVELEKHTPDHEEMYLMSLCEHNIIANSSFSWWSAWLNKNDKKIVVAPEEWSFDKPLQERIHCKNWVKI
jgi:hypothetical protein